MKTLRVTLADIVGPTGTPNSTATVHARYVDTSGRGRDVHLTDGTIVVPVRRVASPDGDPEVFDFDVYANDVAPVREVDYGHLVEVSWTVVAPTGAKTSGVRRVAITDDMDAVVQLGLLSTPTPVPPYTGGYVTPETYATLVGRMDVFEEGGPVWSVNGENGVVVLDAADVGAATTAQGALADTAVQPADLAPFATRETQGPIVAGSIELPSPYEALGQFVHPSIVDAGPGEWNGYRYWMAASAYPFSTRELPFLFVSDDGLNWSTPPGLTNPFLPVSGGASYLQSDPEILLVGSTMHAWSREMNSSNPAAKIERIYHSTSTDGITWATQVLAIDMPTTAGLITGAMSPAVIHDGTQFVMWTCNNLTNVHRRTSTDGVTWTAPTTVTVTGFAGVGVSHVAVTKAASGAGLFMFLMSSENTSVTMETSSPRCVYLGRSADQGASFTFVAEPLLRSENTHAVSIYRTSGLHSVVSGQDFFRLWHSGQSYYPTNGEIVWSIGYSEGFAPDATTPLTSLAVEGSLRVEKDVSGRHGGFTRLSSRFGFFYRAVVGALNAGWVKSNHLFVDQGDGASPFKPPWSTEVGELPLVVRSSPHRSWGSGSVAGMRLISRATDLTAPHATGDYWTISVLPNGSLSIVATDVSAGTAKHNTTFNFDNSVDLANRLRVFTSISSQVLDIGAGADGLNGAGQPIRFRSDNFRVTTAKTPTSTADSSLSSGCWAWDDNYIYVKTAAGWKRSALSTW